MVAAGAYLLMVCLRHSMRGSMPKYRTQKDLNHNDIKRGLEQVGFLVEDTSKLGGFVDLVVKHPARPEAGVKLLEIKSKRGKLSEDQLKLKQAWGESMIEVRTIEDVLTVFGFI